jgi:mono/diheme cytochrome c family protein
MLSISLIATFVACGGGEAPKPVEAPKVEPPKPVEPPPAPAPEPAAAAPAASGPYTPDDLAKAAYEKAAAAGADKAANPKKGDAAAIDAGKAAYAQKCATCHGEKGMGDGIAGSALPQKPGNFTWKERWDATTVGTKHWVVQNGIQGTAMAPLGLTPDQAWEVLAFIESEFAPK